MVKELVFLCENFLDSLAGTIRIIVSSFCVIPTEVEPGGRGCAVRESAGLPLSEPWTSCL